MSAWESAYLVLVVAGFATFMIGVGVAQWMDAKARAAREGRREKPGADKARVTPASCAATAGGATSR